MPVVIVIGVQWGDEGKGKVVDYLTEKANYVVRFQGGNNAGHTVIVDGQKSALKLIPSGILREGTRCLLASGVVLDPNGILDEMAKLAEIGIEVTPERLGISGGTQLIMPYHKAIDQEREAIRAGSKIGTTGKGIGPCYEDAVSRYGIRVSDLSDLDNLQKLVERNVAVKNEYLKSVLKSEVVFSAEEVFAELKELAQKLAPYITNVSVEVNTAIEKNQYLMFEGAQGSLLDITHGTYPFVTSSNTLSGFACVSAGFGPANVDLVLGICKSYCTRVGSGPFPTEDHGEQGDRLREVGGEFGTVTGRPRRCGWFDAVAANRAVRLNGINALVITKLDVLSGLEKIKLGTKYTLDGKEIDDLPNSSQDLERVQADYEEIDGWSEDITGVTDYDSLPENAKKLLTRISELTNSEIVGFSVGPERSQTVMMSGLLDKYVSII